MSNLLPHERERIPTGEPHSEERIQQLEDLKSGKIGKMMSEIVHVYRGEYVSIDLVDDTTELTVENNIYSLTESMELQQDLARGIHKLVTGLLLLKEARSE